MSEQVIDIEAINKSFETAEQNKLSEVRKNAIKTFSRQGFPTTKSEAWKYTNLEKILKKGYAPTAHYQPGELKAASFESFKVTNRDTLRLVFVDGFINENLSNLKDIKGLHFDTLKNKEELNNTVIPNESLIDLNTAFTKDGAIITIDEKAIIEIPIELYNITTCPGLKMIQPKHQIKVGRAAQVTFIESYHNLCVDSSFTNAVTSIEVAQDAIVNYIKIEHPKKPNTYIIDHCLVEQAANSTFNIYTLTLSGALVKNNLQVVLKGEHTTTNMYGLYLLQKSEIVDNRTIVDHAVPNGYSNELYKGILGGTATGTFNGKIYVREDAQKTNAFQSNKNILVSDDATINTRPQLEIYADDVKCSHGATSAQIEDSELFYLRSRGIGKDKAKSLLIYAFASEVWETIKDEEVKNYIENEVSHALGIEI
ncbi:MAG: Fe-S cluster assembly protein SufD [Bacteroidetes bacterium]|nr:Fe-S cluster assembly protein SufD [Bacteroidota bacterium]